MNTVHPFDTAVQNRIRALLSIRGGRSGRGGAIFARQTRELIRDQISHLRRHRAWKATDPDGFGPVDWAKHEEVKAARIAAVIAEKGFFKQI